MKNGLKDHQIALLTNHVKNTLLNSLPNNIFPQSLREIISGAINESLEGMDARIDNTESSSHVKVEVYDYTLDTISRKYVLVKDDKGIAIFHHWGVNYEEFELGIGSYTSAIVERLDGTIENVPCNQIKFIKD